MKIYHGWFTNKGEFIKSPDNHEYKAFQILSKKVNEKTFDKLSNSKIDDPWAHYAVVEHGWIRTYYEVSNKEIFGVITYNPNKTSTRALQKMLSTVKEPTKSFKIGLMTLGVTGKMKKNYTVQSYNELKEELVK